MPDADTGAPLVSVCACTFRRPALLEVLLDGLAHQRHAPRFEVVVVDNDAAGSAGPVLAAARARHPSLELRSAVEPEQNIALARNRALALARGQLVAFIDDDEQPVPRWLCTLHRTFERSGADGVFGPVLPALPPDAPAWIARGGFFERPRHASGQPVPARELRTGNALLRRELLLGASVGAAAPFDPRYGLTGGEDSALLVELQHRGARFLWCDDAVVRERVPRERARLGFVLRRAFGGGLGHARWRLEREGARALPSLLARGGGALWLSSLLAPLTLPLGLHHAIGWGRVGAAGAGKLAALAGVQYQPYRVTAGLAWARGATR